MVAVGDETKVPEKNPYRTMITIIPAALLTARMQKARRADRKAHGIMAFMAPTGMKILVIFNNKQQMHGTRRLTFIRNHPRENTAECTGGVKDREEIEPKVRICKSSLDGKALNVEERLIKSQKTDKDR